MASLVVLAEPVISAVAAFLVLGEPIAVIEAVGGLVAIAAVGVIVRNAARAGSLDESAEAAPA